MSVTKSNQNNLTSPNGNSLAVFVDINDNALKLKDINGGVEPITNYTGSSSVGLLQLQGGVALSSTLTSVTDQNNTTSPLKLSTTDVQVLSPLRITTADASGFYLDCEDSSTNNRFSIKRDPASQLVTLDFASNPIGTTTNVGAIRTYVDGTNLSEVMTFREDGNVGIGTTAPIAPLNVYNSSASVSNLLLLEQDTSALIGQIINYRKNGSVNLTSGTEIGRLAFGGYFNSTYSPPSQTCSAIYGYYGGTGTDRVGGLRLVTWNGGGLTTRLQVAPDGKIGIGTTIATAKLEILGEGSTSATTAFKIQNSLSTQLGYVDDSGQWQIGTGTNGGYKLDVNGAIFARGAGSVSLWIEGSTAIRGNSTTSGQIYIDASRDLTGTIDIRADLVNVRNNLTAAGLITTVDSVNAGNNANGKGISINSNIVLNVKADNTVLRFNDNSQFVNVGMRGNGYQINDTTIPTLMTFNNSALLDVSSTTRGFLPPRMTTAQKVTLAATATAGLMIYDTNLNKLCVYTGAGWETITSV